MTINVPLLRKTLEHIEAHPEEWNQGVWLCATSACFAGHAVVLAGGEWVEIEHAVFVRADADDNPADLANVDDKGQVVTVADRAQRILGLSWREARILFHSDNNLDDLRRIVGELIEQAGES